ncbi:aminotransferase class V-fold PLP-dependent enzyme [Zavarzinia sp. CC-PAN008]|uniref:aminotransferase class V-fold PLP-dependent enzyme n=1 Tax=Zavarzinia sp. CC-PAN008 TaxID=3243332 RepID=UPI003F74326B
MKLDVGFARAQFPQFSNGWAFLENAGGTYVPQPVIDHVTRYMTEVQVQPAWSFAPSADAAGRIARGKAAAAAFVNATAPEILIGPSTTLNVYVLAQAVASLLQPGDEIVVTEQDHEANSGAWRRLAQRGIRVKEWQVDPVTGELSLDVLAALVTPATRLIALCHCSNIVGTFNDIPAVVEIARRSDAFVCVDGVAYTPHRLPDVQALGVDAYAFSLYKTFGPHVGLMYVGPRLRGRVAAQNHFFIDDPLGALNPGGPSHEMTAALVGIQDYFQALHARHFNAPAADFRTCLEAVYELAAAHEDELGALLLDGLNRLPGVRIIGRTRIDGRRAPTVSFVLRDHASESVADALAAEKVAVGHGDFYAQRCVAAVGLMPDGVVRASIAHYNTHEDVARFLDALGRL